MAVPIGLIHVTLGLVWVWSAPVLSDMQVRRQEETSKTVDSSCQNIWCGIGRECEVRGERTVCTCARSCDSSPNLVCADDGRTYESLCDMYRLACYSNKRLEKLHNGPCYVPHAERRLSQPLTKPLVCHSEQAEEIRHRLVNNAGHVTTTAGMSAERSSREIMVEMFAFCDSDKNLQLSMEEFSACSTASLKNTRDAGTMAEAGSWLCLESIWLTLDADADDIVTFEQFLTLFDPAISLGRKQCDSEGLSYDEGYEIKRKCNICICVMGNWVCTASSCQEPKGQHLRYGRRYDRAPTRTEGESSNSQPAAQQPEVHNFPGMGMQEGQDLFSTTEVIADVNEQADETSDETSDDISAKDGFFMHRPT